MGGGGGGAVVLLRRLCVQLEQSARVEVGVDVALGIDRLDEQLRRRALVAHLELYHVRGEARFGKLLSRRQGVQAESIELRQSNPAQAEAFAFCVIARHNLSGIRVEFARRQRFDPEMLQRLLKLLEVHIP